MAGLERSFVCRKMESVVQQMQDSNTGIPIKTVSTFMYKIPSVFSGGQTNLTTPVQFSDQQCSLHLYDQYQY